MTRYVAFLLLIAVSGCVSGPRPAGDGCAGWQPIRPTAEDVERMSDALVAQVLAHNEHGAAVCGWRPR